MSSIIIISSNKEATFFQLDKVLTTFGDSKDHDFKISEIAGAGISILKENDALLAMPIDPRTKKLKGPWNEPLKKVSFLQFGAVEFIIFPQSNLINQNQELVDWDFSDLPKNPMDKDYPSHLLSFLLKTIHSNEGALFLWDDKHGLKTLSSQNIKIKDKASFFIHELLRDKSKTVYEVDFNTHSTLFSESPLEKNFLLIRSPLPHRGEVILYLPDLESEKIPKGMIKSLLYFAAQGLSLHQVHQYNLRFKKRLKPRFTDDFYFGATPQMERLKSLSDKLAKTDLSLLILGETGSGKDMLARYIVDQRPNRKFITINCAAIPKDLAESVLFGHKKGSFTGAHEDRLGKISQADGGTLFLDEIAELNLETQGKLLRVLQDRIVQPIGGTEHRVNVRIIAATHRNLNELIAKGEFREDLYFRLNEASLFLPPLRQRDEDIEVLSQGFLEDVCQANQLEPKSLDPSCCYFLRSYQFPGNVRELRSLIRRAAVLSDGPIITETDLKAFVHVPGNSNTPDLLDHFPFQLNEAKKKLTNKLVKRALKISQGNKTKAAEHLGITPRSLFRLLAEMEQDVKGLLTDKNVSPHDLRA